jgi:Flp pilus assembly pilin Flp
MISRFRSIQKGQTMNKFHRKKQGQSLTEYGFILTLVTVVCIGALQLLGVNFSTLMNNVSAQLSAAIGG